MQRGQSCAFAAARCGSALARKTSASLSLALVSKRVLGLRPRLGPRLDWLCLQTSNQFNRHPCDTPRYHQQSPRPDFRPCKQSLQILSTVGARNVRQTCVRASDLLMRHLLSPPCAARCQSSSSPIIIERFPTPAVRTCVRTDQNLISPPSMLRLSI